VRGGRFKAGDVFDAYQERERSLIRDAILAFINREKLQSSQHIGNLLKRFKDRNEEGLVLEPKKVSGSLTYWVKLTDDTHRERIGHLTTRPHGSEASNDPSRAA
jgi:hypothetical protein